MILRRTTTLPWDDLDSQACAEDGSPDWNSMVVIGPIRRRDRQGRVTLEWTVTVQCSPVGAPPPPAE